MFKREQILEKKITNFETKEKEFLYKIKKLKEVKEEIEKKDWSWLINLKD